MTIDMDFKSLQEETKEKIKTFTISGILIVLFYLAVSHFNTVTKILGKIISVLAPFLYGAIITLVLIPIRKYVENNLLGKVKMKERSKRKIAVLICMIIFFLFFVAFVALLVPRLAES